MLFFAKKEHDAATIKLLHFTAFTSSFIIIVSEGILIEHDLTESYVILK